MSKCADCTTEVNPLDAYRIRPPRDSEEWKAQHGPYYLCADCWEGIVGNAFMQAIR